MALVEYGAVTHMPWKYSKGSHLVISTHPHLTFKLICKHRDLGVNDVIQRGLYRRSIVILLLHIHFISGKANKRLHFLKLLKRSAMTTDDL